MERVKSYNKEKQISQIEYDLITEFIKIRKDASLSLQ